jgi:hypothetical protein
MSRSLARALFPWMAAVGLASPSASATAAPSVTATSATPAFRLLPEGHVSPAPSTAAPAHVAAGEQVSGFVFASTPPEQAKMLRMNQVGVSYLFGSAARANAFSAGRGDEDDEASATCFVDGESASAPTEQEEGEVANTSNAQSAPPAKEWPAQGSSMLSMQFPLGSSGARTHAVHTETLVVDGGGQASLEMTDAWADAQTHGVRLIGRSRLPLRRIFIGPNGVEVYAAREGAAVQVVVRPPKSPADPELRSLIVALPGGQSGASDCSHLRFVLRAGRGQGQMAAMQSIALLPPLDGDEPVITDEAEGSPQTRASLLLQGMRRRPYQLSISATQSGADPDPVLTVSVGWVGRERPGGFTGREG